MPSNILKILRLRNRERYLYFYGNQRKMPKAHFTEFHSVAIRVPSQIRWRADVTTDARQKALSIPSSVPPSLRSSQAPPKAYRPRAPPQAPAPHRPSHLRALGLGPVPLPPSLGGMGGAYPHAPGRGHSPLRASAAPGRPLYLPRGPTAASPQSRLTGGCHLGPATPRPGFRPAALSLAARATHRKTRPQCRRSRAG